MRTFVCVQLFLLCVSVSFGVERVDFIPLWMFAFPCLAAQFSLWFFSFFKFEWLWYASLGLLSLAFFSAGVLFLVAFVRMWRFFFFPQKEELEFALECLARIPLQGLQLGVMLLQSGELRLKLRPPKYIGVLYANMIFVLFFHDFVYAWVLGAYGGWYVVLGLTQFLTHVAMGFLVRGVDKPMLYPFMLLWTALLVQHVLTSWALYGTDWYTLVLGMNVVYVVSLLMYLLNGYLKK